VPYLLRRIADTLIERFTGELEPYGITLPMWRVLAVLHRRGATRFGMLVSQTLIEHRPCRGWWLRCRPRVSSPRRRRMWTRAGC